MSNTETMRGSGVKRKQLGTYVIGWLSRSGLESRRVATEVSAAASRLKVQRVFAGFGGAAVILTVGCSLIFEPIEQRFLYRPWNPDSARLASLASRENGVDEVRLKTPDGVTLHGWLKRPQQVRAQGRFPLVIVFGGVRRETSWMIDRGKKRAGWGWLFVNYRGYGLSEGEPSEDVLLEDTALIYDYAAARTDVEASNIVLLGRSLGAYFAVALAAKRKVRGAILATPFDSFAALGRERYPWLPVGLLLNGRYDAVAMAPEIKVPALFVLAERDDITPVERGAALAREWGGPRRTVMLAGARHYGIERREEFWEAVGNFLRELEADAAERDVQAVQAGSTP